MINAFRIMFSLIYLTIGGLAVFAISYSIVWVFGLAAQAYLVIVTLAILYVAWIVINLTPIGDKFQDLTLNTRRPSPREKEKLDRIVADLKLRAQNVPVARFPEPRLRMVSDEAPNAMAFGTHSIAMTTGMLKANEDQARAVFAHELGHLANRDVHFLSLKIAALHLPLMIWNWICRPVLRMLSAGGSDGSFMWIGLMLILIIFLLPFFIFGFVGILTLRMTGWFERLLSQPTEYKADEYSVKLTQDRGLPNFLDAIAPLDSTPQGAFLAAYVRSHPPTELRHAKAEEILNGLGRPARARA